MDVAAGPARRPPPAWHPVSHAHEPAEAVTADTGQETDLVARARSGDREAFEHLVRLHADRLYAVVLRFLGDRH
jgi:hypothetical protein